MKNVSNRLVSHEEGFVHIILILLVAVFLIAVGVLIGDDERSRAHALEIFRQNFRDLGEDVFAGDEAASFLPSLFVVVPAFFFAFIIVGIIRWRHNVLSSDQSAYD